MRQKKNDHNLPRVLVIGQRFHFSGGGGVTQSNLFKDWPSERLFSLPLQGGTSKLGICNNVYELSAKNRLLFGVFRTKVPFYETANNSENRNVINDLYRTQHNRKKNKNRIIDGLNRVLRITGLIHVKYIYRLDSNLISWLKQINVDLVYVHYSTLSGMLFISKIVKYLNKPMVVHFMDDWIKTPQGNASYSWIWKKIYKDHFSKLLNMSADRIAISKSMAEEYKHRYGYSFDYLNNPIDPKLYFFNKSQEYQIREYLRIGYFGRIGRGNQAVIQFLIDSIQGTKYRLDIYTVDNIPKHENGANLTYCKSIEHSQIPKTMSKYDLLLLPLDFDSDSVKFVKHSMPTKIGEYLMSGTPILLIAPPETAVHTYLEDKDAAFIISYPDKKELLKLLDSICANPSLTSRILDNAKKSAIQDFSRDVIIERFHTILSKAASNKG